MTRLSNDDGFRGGYDAECDDGGSGSDYDVCAFGTDCEVGFSSKNDLSKQLWFCV